MSDPVEIDDLQKWLIEQWLENFGQVVKSMVDDPAELTWAVSEGGELGPSPLLVEQKFAASPGPLLWVGVPEETWRDLGTRVLKAAGMDTVSDEESRSTTLEIVQQAIGGLAQAMTGKLEREIAAPPSREPALFPDKLTVLHLSVKFGESQLPPVWVAFSPSLIAWFEEKPAEAVVEQSLETTEDQMAGYPNSKTFKLLLDVALPVSISFGKTELAVRDVLKLTTGSIVELNRAVTEPVDLIVNNCIIARGEVVVVNGNYGVRIHHIASRQERLRTGSSSEAVTRLVRT